MEEVREPIPAYGKSKISGREYLAFERAASEKHEFYQGEVFRMHGHGELLTISGASKRRNIIFQIFSESLLYG